MGGGKEVLNIGLVLLASFRPESQAHFVETRVPGVAVVDQEFGG